MNLPPVTSKPLWITVVVVALLAWLFLSATPTPRQDSPQPPTEDPSADGDVQGCSGLIENALVMLDPAALGITSDSDTAVSVLNQWLALCNRGLDSKAADATLERLLSAEELKRIEGDRFLPRDGRHVRDCLWCKKTVEFTLRAAHRELDRVVSLFYYVVRNVDLIGTPQSPVPLTPFGAMMFGKGTPEQRAWIFAEFLRQMRMDSVILKPQASAGDTNAPSTDDRWLIGVILQDGVYLFDTRLGLPVPSKTDDTHSPLIHRPATLAEVRKDPTVLKALDLDSSNPYPLTSQDLQDVRVELIGNTGYWSARMHAFQGAMTGDRFAVVSDSLQDDDVGPGMWSRVANVKFDGAAPWKTEAVSVWPYPERQLEANDQMTEEQKQIFSVMQRTLLVPVPIQQVSQVKDEEGKPRLSVKFGAPERLHLQKRTEQLLGEFRSAIQGYLLIRLWRDLPPTPKEVSRDLLVAPQLTPLLASQIPPELRAVHAVAALEAYYRTGVCQFEQGEFERAEVTFRNLIADLVKNGVKDSPWTDSSRYLLALTLAELGKTKEAIQTLEAISPKHPQHWGLSLLLRRWKAADGTASPEPATPSSEKTPATDK